MQILTELEEASGFDKIHEGVCRYGKKFLTGTQSVKDAIKYVRPVHVTGKAYRDLGFLMLEDFC